MMSFQIPKTQPEEHGKEEDVNDEMEVLPNDLNLDGEEDDGDNEADAQEEGK